jgi:chorismate synthase
VNRAQPYALQLKAVKFYPYIYIIKAGVCLFGSKIRAEVFGESHGVAIGVVLTGLPAGEPIDLQQVQAFMKRRAPGQNKASTARTETDIPKIISGFLNGKTTGAPLCAFIENTDTRSGDYAALSNTPRPGHADYPAFIKYKGFNDPRGGGHFSGRLTAALCFAGAVCKQILERRGVFVGAHALNVGGISDACFSSPDLNKNELLAPGELEIPVICRDTGIKMLEAVETASQDGDSVGGIVECAAIGLPAGIGGPLTEGVEGILAKSLFGIPAVRGVEFGLGFSAANLRGSQTNDAYFIKNGEVAQKTNHCGGVLGGITTGAPFVLKVAFKPTPSVSKPQQTVSLADMTNATLSVAGRHDPCVVFRAVPVVEAVTALELAGMILS